MFAAAVPEASGGLGAGFVDVAAMVEQCGIELVPGARRADGDHGDHALH